MAGHSKWANIKHRKAAQDARRSKLFTKLLREVQIAARMGGPDPESNPRLRAAIQNARGASVPKDNIERAIKKGSGGGGEDYVELKYEGTGPGGVAIIVECATDNTNRTVSNVRSYFNKFGGSLAKSGSMDYIFSHKGVFTIPLDEVEDPEALELELIEAGAEDIEVEDGWMTVYCDKRDFGNIQKFLESEGLAPKESGLQYIPSITKTLTPEQFKSVMKLIDMLENDDDVQKVYHNIELTEELEKMLSA